MSNLTIYNCGTGYHRGNDDVVMELYRATTSAKDVTDGVGTNSVWTSSDRTTNHSGMVIGNLFAGDIDVNVRKMVEAVKAAWLLDPALTVDMCGWSRGAVTCFKIASVLSRSTVHGLSRRSGHRYSRAPRISRCKTAFLNLTFLVIGRHGNVDIAHRERVVWRSERVTVAGGASQLHHIPPYCWAPAVGKCTHHTT
jgi:hypothetical protein